MSGARAGGAEHGGARPEREGRRLPRPGMSRDAHGRNEFHGKAGNEAHFDSAWRSPRCACPGHEHPARCAGRAARVIERGDHRVFVNRAGHKVTSIAASAITDAITLRAAITITAVRTQCTISDTRITACTWKATLRWRTTRAGFLWLGVQSMGRAGSLYVGIREGAPWYGFYGAYFHAVSGVSDRIAVADRLSDFAEPGGCRLPGTPGRCRGCGRSGQWSATGPGGRAAAAMTPRT